MSSFETSLLPVGLEVTALVCPSSDLGAGTIAVKSSTAWWVSTEVLEAILDRDRGPLVLG